MSAKSHLESFGVTTEQARAFILNNLDNLPYLIEVCKQFDITNSMLAEIYGGVTPEIVVEFFKNNGIDSTTLVPDSLRFNANDLVGQTVYGITQNQDGSIKEIMSFAFNEDSISAAEGLTENPDQFNNIPYRINDDGYLVFFADEGLSTTLHTVAIVKDIDNLNGNELSWRDIENPVEGFDTVIADSIIEAHKYNQAIETDTTTNEYFFYSFSDASSYIL